MENQSEDQTVIFCKPFNMDVQIETCKSRLLVIKNQCKKEGLVSLTKEQRKCHDCDYTREQEPETEGSNDMNTGADAAKNGLTVLNKSLFDQLERLNNPGMKGDELSMEIERTKAIAELGKQIISTGRLTLDVIKTVKPANRSDFLKLEE